MSDHEVVSQWVDPNRVRVLAEGLLKGAPGKNDTPDESFYGESFEGFTDQPAKKVWVGEEKGGPKGEPLEIPAAKTEVTKLPPSEEPSTRSDPFRSLKSPAKEATPKVRTKIRPLPISQAASQSSPTAQEKESAIRNEASSPFQPARKRDDPPSSPPASEKPARLARKLDSTNPGGGVKPFIKWLQKQAPVHSFFMIDSEGKVIFDEVKDRKLRNVAHSLGQAAHMKEGSSADDSQKILSRVRLSEDRVMEILPLESPDGLITAALLVERPLKRSAVDIIARTFKASYERSSPAGE